jgi:hypothetical protein
MLETIGVILVGGLLAGATTLGLVASQGDAPAGGGLPESGTVVTYDQGQ